MTVQPGNHEPLGRIGLGERAPRRAWLGLDPSRRVPAGSVRTGTAAPVRHRAVPPTAEVLDGEAHPVLALTDGTRRAVPPPADAPVPDASTPIEIVLVGRGSRPDNAADTRPRRGERRVAEGDLIDVGAPPTRGGSMPLAASPGETAERSPRIARRLRHALLLLLAAYYMGWGLYGAFQQQPLRAIVVPAPMAGRAIA